MKRVFYVSACVCLLMLVSVSSAWAIWEGNAGIAGASEFTASGLYARSDMFPKNTIVDIQNLEKDISVRVLITGSSSVPGLVAVLSPETAAALSIRTGSVCRVRISIPSPINEKPASGTYNSGSGTENADPDINPAVAASQAATASAASSAAATAASIPLSFVVVPAADPLVPLADVPIVGDETEVAEETEVVEETLVWDEGTESSENPEFSEMPSEAETPAESAVFYDEPSVEVPLNEGFSEAVEVTLVPAEPNPPDAVYPPAIEPVIPATPVPAIPPVVSLPPTAVPSVESFVVRPPQAFDLPYITSFSKGSYYIQIATYSSILNAQSAVDSFGKKYPVAVERIRGKNGELLKVYIGPVKKDEFGAVLERFKQLGFKDAFVKKGQ